MALFAPAVLPKMQGTRRNVRREVAVGRISHRATVLSCATFLGFAAACTNSPGSTGLEGTPATGGRITVTYRTAPRSFNRYVQAHIATELVSRLTQAPLVRLNRVTRDPEPWLAESWHISPDEKTWTLQLRRGVTFSDGAPFTSADVLFSFQAIYDPKNESPLASSVSAGGKPLTARALDDYTVVLTLAEPYGAGVALLDTLPIYPRHKLKAALEAGTFRDAWGPATTPADLVGLGPFVLQEHVPQQRLVFARNPKYWRKDAAGRALPYLDAIEVQVVPEANAEVLRFEAGQVDLMTDQIRAEDVASLGRLRDQGKIALVDLGVSLSPDMLWFNLAHGAAVAKGRTWLQRDELRQAIASAVDRQAVVNTVYLGAAEPVSGPITRGHGDWYVADLAAPELDRARAGALLDRLGLVDRNGDGARDDASGKTAKIAVLTQKGNTTREKLAVVLQDQLKQVGLAIDIVPADASTLAQRWQAGDYDAILYGFLFDTYEPLMDFWMSSGPFHVWNPGQAKPGTVWESEIDDLMRRQVTSSNTVERRRLFSAAQRTFAIYRPALYFAAPKMTVAMSSRLRGATPAILAPPVLWNAEVLSIGPAGAARK